MLQRGSSFSRCGVSLWAANLCLLCANSPVVTVIQETAPGCEGQEMMHSRQKARVKTQALRRKLQWWCETLAYCRAGALWGCGDSPEDGRKCSLMRNLKGYIEYNTFLEVCQNDLCWTHFGAMFVDILVPDFHQTFILNFITLFLKEDIAQCDSG